MADRLQNFIKYLQFPEPPAKDDLAKEIEGLHPDDLVPQLLELINETDSVLTKQAAIDVLTHLRDSTTLKPLLDLILNEEDANLRKTAIKSVGVLGYTEAIPTLEKVMNRTGDTNLIQICSQVIQVLQGVTSLLSLEEL